MGDLTGNKHAEATKKRSNEPVRRQTKCIADMQNRALIAASLIENHAKNQPKIENKSILEPPGCP